MVNRKQDEKCLVLDVGGKPKMGEELAQATPGLSLDSNQGGSTYVFPYKLFFSDPLKENQIEKPLKIILLHLMDKHS